MTNNYNNITKFYEFINVEQKIRFESKELVNVYFIALFACCRELFVKGKKMGQQVHDPPTVIGAPDLNSTSDHHVFVS